MFDADSATATLSLGKFSGRFGSIGFSSSATMGGTLVAGVEAVTGYDTADTAEVEVLVVTAPAWVVSFDPAACIPPRTAARRTSCWCSTPPPPRCRRRRALRRSLEVR